LQDELSKTIKELAARNSEVQELQQEAKQAGSEKERLRKINCTAEQTLERDKKKISEFDRKMEELQRERSELVKERDQLDIRRKKLEAEVVSKDARINRLTEECERYKSAAKDIGTQDRDRAAADKRETDRLTSEVKKLERQRAELVNAFKKQMKLIDVLKRQRAHVEAARVLSFTEDEFIRILELGDKLGE
jgi:chromosome segregation ATPase